MFAPLVRGLSQRGRRVFSTGARFLATESGAARSQAAPAPTPVPLSQMQDSFVNGGSSAYIDSLRDQYDRDPKSVDPSWAAFFQQLDKGVSPAAISEAYSQFRAGSVASGVQVAGQASQQEVQDAVNLIQLIRAYQVAGHTAARVDPLNLASRPTPEILNPKFYGFNEQDLDREIRVNVEHLKGFLGATRPRVTLRYILDRLRDVYCGSVGYEYMHIPDRAQCNWIRERIELLEKPEIPRIKKMHTLDRLAWSEHFESFLANKYVAAKRFGLEGAETLVPGMKAMIDHITDLGAEVMVLGMPHRGRLNVLGNVVRKPLAQIFHEFSGSPSEKDEGFGSGDVKYHLGTSFDRPTASGKKIHLSLMANPSHLEAVNTLVLGKVKAKQFYLRDNDKSRVVPVLLHGDGAFSGQGIVYETLDISTLPDYDVGGCIHIVVNNQVAFTTDAKQYRSNSPYSYCTDVARGLNCPVFHVNGDDVESVVRVFELAAEWRQKWKSDVVIDLVCYRKYGHNEIDEPMFTQPAMYQVIRKKQNPFEIYRDKLVSSGVVSKEEAAATSQRVMDTLEAAYEESKSYVPRPKDWLSSYWEGFKGPMQHARIKNVGVPMPMLQEVGARITELPGGGFKTHRTVQKLYEARREALSSPEGLVDWGTAEALAFGTLLKEGFHVRLSGQDVERGTFSHRHAVLHDQEGRGRYVPLDHVFDGQPKNLFTCTNSSLSEFGVLGYELGYSLENPNSLVMWEAQFGDFANGAQVIFDQFMSSGEAKWLRQSGLTVLLPHGYDSQGPEHSSARLERFLQMCDEDPYRLPTVDASQWFRGGHLGSQTQTANWQVCNVTTPANYFMLLRRQVHREFRKPLVLMSPKALLRHPACKSKLFEFDDIPDEEGIQGVRFKRLIMDKSSTSRAQHPPAQESFERVIFCSGKIYYELDEAREKAGLRDKVAICRVEQLSPFPFDLVSRDIRRFPNATPMWVQEEPQNMGAYHYVVPRMNACLRGEGRQTSGRLAYAGRPPSASTATGFATVHKVEQAKLMEKAMDLAYKGL